MTTPLPINSDDVFEHIEHHFRITAGPGAGKTYWLAQHIRHVTRMSNRLTPCAKIGVISYTNVAVREILRRLGTVADAADVSTIHSFLFRNLVRPYTHLLKDETGADLIAHQLVDTHGEHYPARKHLDTWLTVCGRKQLLITAMKNSFDLLQSRLRSLTVRIDESGNAYFAPCKSEPRDKGIKDLLTPEKLLAYKRLYWANGTIDHEDVLYVAYRLLHAFPMLCRFLSARFPYLFIDEFQDTLPVQAEVVRWLANEGTVVGVIGDPEQAIYGFLDASASHFRDFRLPNFRPYQITGNRRSTHAIVSFLKGIRTDGLVQQPVRGELGLPPKVFGGSLDAALTHARSTSAHAAGMLVLARSHAGVLRARRSGQEMAADPWDALQEAGAERCRFLHHLAAAVDLAHRRLYDISMQRLVQGISTRRGFREPLQYDGEVGMVTRRSLALSLLEYMMSHHDEFLPKTALDVYNALQSHAPSCLVGLKLPSVRAGKFQEAASSCDYRGLFESVKTTDETRLTRTIHQAKGGEARAVFVVLDDGISNHILSPVPGDEEQRITYVALSRAQDELYIYCPEAERLPAFEAIGAVTLTIGAAAVAPKRRKRAKQTPS